MHNLFFVALETKKVIFCVICLCMCTNPAGQFIYGIVYDRTEQDVHLPFYVAALLMTGIIIFTRHIFSGVDEMVENHTEHVI